MLPVTPYKALKYPPSNLFPRSGDAGSLPPQYRRGGNEHLQAMIARRQASQKLLTDRAAPQAERPGEVFHDAMEDVPEVPEVPEELDPDVPPLEEVPAEMPPRGPPPDDEAQMEPVEPVDHRRRARQFQGAGQFVGMGAGGLIRGIGAAGYYGGYGALGLAQGAVQMMGGAQGQHAQKPQPARPGGVRPRQGQTTTRRARPARPQEDAWARPAPHLHALAHARPELVRQSGGVFQLVGAQRPQHELVHQVGGLSPRRRVHELSK